MIPACLSRHVLPVPVCRRGLPGAVCLRRFVFVNTVAGGAAVGGGSRMTDKEKEESCGL